jgi:hypothetical protein
MFEASLFWRKSMRSETVNCIEVATTVDFVALRDSKDPDGPKLSFTHASWRLFVDETRRNCFNES